jgi:hypothetical protein
MLLIGCIASTIRRNTESSYATHANVRSHSSRALLRSRVDLGIAVRHLLHVF